MHAIGFMKPLQDPQQDVVLRGQPLAFGNRTLAVFKRPLTPCDTEHDLPFLAGTPQTVIWAIGQSSALAYHGNANRGYTVVDFQPLLANDTAAAGLPCISDSSSIIHNTSSNIQNNSSNIHNNSGSIQNNSSSNIPALPDAVPSSGCPSIKEPVQVADLTFNNQLIPPQETTYMCKFIHLPSDRKYHIVSYTGVVTSKFLHHMVLDKCRRVRNDFVIQIFRGASTVKPPGMTPQQAAGQPWDCTTSGPPCSESVMIWAPGTGSVQLPQQAGLPFGDGEAEWFSLNAHYTNEQGVTGQVDSSGFRVSYTSQLRPHDMGVLRLGEMHLVIPPGQAAHTSPPNLCPATCTRKLKTPLTLVYNYFHMHQTGTAISTRLIRNGQELQPLGEIRSYDFNFQGASPILSAARQLLPGDSLLTTCVFDSRKRNTTTTFGASTFNEMCYNFLAYYPRDSGINTCMHVHADSNALCGDFSGALNTGALSSVFGSAPINATAVKLGLSQGWLVPSAGSNITYKPYQPAPCHNVSKNSV
eukprot:jgi/Chrzof1/10740/Cz05g10200.t1